MAEALIRQRVEDLAKALRAKDIDGIMSLYAPRGLYVTIGTRTHRARRRVVAGGANSFLSLP
jgi:ketosteroid isomerase-like protein